MLIYGFLLWSIVKELKCLCILLKGIVSPIPWAEWNLHNRVLCGWVVVHGYWLRKELLTELKIHLNWDWRRHQRRVGWLAVGQKDEKKVDGQISLVNFLPYLGHSKISEKFIRLERFEIWKPWEGGGLKITVSLEYHPTVWLLRRPLWRWYCTMNHFHGINKTGIMFMWVDLVPIYTRSKAGLVFIISPFTPPLTTSITSSHCPFTSVMPDPLHKLPYPTDNFNQNCFVNAHRQAGWRDMKCTMHQFWKKRDKEKFYIWGRRRKWDKWDKFGRLSAMFADAVGGRPR